MKDIDKMLTELGAVARCEAPCAVDVRARVLATIRTEQPVLVRHDWVPIFAGGFAVAVAALFVVALSPSWNAMFEPWISYFPK
jgi:hypothetical protein